MTDSMGSDCIATIVFPSVPGVLLPLFLQIFRYASMIFCSDTINGMSLSNVFPFWLSSNNR